MANNLIQIRRSNTSSTPGTTLVSGELAYSYSGNNLFIGAQTGIGTAATKIAGAKFGFVDNATAGTLTANAAKITDSNAFISNTFTVGLFVAPSIASPVANSTAALITSITPQYSAGQLGATVDGSNTELATTWAIKSYVDNKTAAATTNVNAQYAWTNTQTFAANVSYITNGSAVAFGNSTIAVGISANGTLGTSGQSLLSNGTSVYWGTPTGLFSNGTAYIFSAVESFIANVAIAGNATSQLLVGTAAANLIANQTGLVVSTNSTAFATVNATTHAVANGTTLVTLDITGLDVGNTAANAVLTSSALTLTVNATASSLTNTTAVAVTNGTAYANHSVSGFSASAGSLLLGNTAANTVINTTSQISYANATTYTLANSTTQAIVDTTTSTQALINTTAVQLNTGAVRVGTTSTNVVINTTSIISQSNLAQFGTAFYSFANGMVSVGNAAPSNGFTVAGSTFIRDKLQVGVPSAFDFGSTALIEIDANQNTYTQVVITNGNNGIASSGDFVVTADTGNDSINFVNFGINGSGYNQAAFNIGGALDAYLYSSNSNLTIGTATVKDVIFHAGGTTSADRKLTINTTAVAFANSVGILANGSLGTSGQVLSSNSTGLYWQSPSGIFSNGSSYIWSAVQTFNANASFGSNVFVTSGAVQVGNTVTTNTVANTSAFIAIANSAGVANTIVSAQHNTTSFAVNAVSINATANATSVGAIVNATTFTLTSNVLSTNTSVASNSFVANTSGITLGNTTVNSSLTTAALTVPTVTAISNATLGSQVTVSNTLVNFGSVANIHAASANLTVSNMSVTGNLSVSGTITAIDTVNLQVKDNVILLADNNTAADAIDFGVVGQANSGLAGTQSYYGIARIATANTFQLFATNTAPGATTIAGQTTMPLQAFLRPFGTSGAAFVVNSTAVSAVANATVSVNITANTVTITSGLAATSGGTGRTTGFTAGDLLYASSTTVLANLAIAANGNVLQVTNNLPAWGTLDGGTF
jgi:hypothetical protein